MKEQKFLFVFADDQQLEKLLSEGWRITHISAAAKGAAAKGGCYVVIERTKFMNGNEKQESTIPNITEDKPLVY